MFERRELNVRLTDEEIAELGRKQSHSQKELEIEEADARSDASTHRKKVKEIKKAISELADAINTGTARRLIECREVRDLEAGKVYVVRTDLAEDDPSRIVETRDLTHAERQGEIFASVPPAEQEAALAREKERAAAEEAAKAPPAESDEERVARAEDEDRLRRWSPADGKEVGLELARRVFGDAAVDAELAELAPMPPADGPIPDFTPDAGDVQSALEALKAKRELEEEDDLASAPDYSAAAEIAADQLATGSRPEGEDVKPGKRKAKAQKSTKVRPSSLETKAPKASKGKAPQKGTELADAGSLEA